MKKMMEEVLSQVTDLKAEGDLILGTSKSLQMSAQDLSLSVYKVSSSQILGLRLIKDGRVGVSYTESLDKESLQLMVAQALENAETNDPNEFERILHLEGELRDEMEYPEEEVDISLKTQKTIELEKRVKERDSRVEAVPHNGFAESESESHYLSSRGRYTKFKDKSYQIWTSALMNDNGKKASYYDVDISHTFNQLNWDKVVEESLFHAQHILKEKVIPTGKYQVRFTEDALKSMMEVFSGLYSAKAAIDKVNPWAEKLGSAVTSSDLSIEDHPTFERAFRASRFDSEGVACAPLTLVEDGVLKSFYHNSITALKLGAKTTGHGSRGPQSSLNISGTHLLIHGKNPKPMAPKYLEIFQLDGLHAGTNRITGDFSLGVKGYVWEGKERVMSFGNVTLSGNFFNMLKNVEVNGTELLGSRDSSFFSVPLTFTDLSIAGS